MNAFIGDLGPSASSYLCWYGDAPVGKTALLADYVRNPPPGVDILNFFVSVGHGTHMRAAFEEYMAAELGAFLNIAQPAVPLGAQAWRRLLRQAAKRSEEHGRKLLLIVDGLDDDVAWSGPVADRKAPATPKRTAPKLGRGSIAALLPASPPSAMRVIVSLRRCVEFPGDLPAHHPLRRRTSMRALAPIPGLPLASQRSPGLSGLLQDPIGAVVAGLLASAGGGLRMADIAQLTDAPIRSLRVLMEGPQGRSFVLDDPVSRTYALADAASIQGGRELLGEEGLAQHTRTLLDWAESWRAAGWPEGTPPYPLVHQLRLLTHAADRAAYVFDFVRLRRLASSHGAEAAFVQLETFEAEADAGDTDADPATLAKLVFVAVARAALKREAREVLHGAPALFFRLGKTQRAHDLARFAATAEERAVHLADLAVESAHAGQEGADVFAREAAGWLTRTHHVGTGTRCSPETNTGILTAARALVSLDALSGAQLLLRAVGSQNSPGIDVLCETGLLLARTGDIEFIAALWDRAETLSQGGLEARAVAVEYWGALARIMPSLSGLFGSRISAICDELERADGLAAVDVFSVAASTLATLPGPRRRRAEAGKWTRQALDLIRGALAAPDALSNEDRAHLSRELSRSLARLAQATGDTQPVARSAGDDIGQMLAYVPTELQIGVLGDDIAARGWFIGEDVVQQRAQSENDALAAAKEKVNAVRRVKDEDRRNRAAENARIRATRRAKPMPQRGEQVGQQAEPAQSGDESHTVVKSRPAKRPAHRHRPSAGLQPLGESPQPQHLRLLHEADERLGEDDPLGSRELLEAALQRAPLPQPSPSDSQDWKLHLMQALGTVGDCDAGEALVRTASDSSDRARLLAALSLGCSLGGHLEQGARYARHAATLPSSGTKPSVANAAAQALAYAGYEHEATALVAGRVAERRQAQAAVAVGLVRRCPEGAARIAAALTEELVHRIEEGSPLHVLPELASLLLAYPDIRQPAPQLREAIQLAADREASARQSWHGPSKAVVQLLQKCDLLPQEDAHILVGTTERWRSSIHPGQVPHLELALLFAINGEMAELIQHAEAAANAGARAQMLCAGAAYFAGVDVALAADSQRGDRVLRTCLALAWAAGGGSPPNELTAGQLVRRALATGDWVPVVPLLPRIAPAALGHLSRVAHGGEMQG